MTIFLVSTRPPGIYACTQDVYRRSICHDGDQGPINELARIGYRESTRQEYITARTALSPHANAAEIAHIVTAMP